MKTRTEKPTSRRLAAAAAAFVSLCALPAASAAVAAAQVWPQPPRPLPTVAPSPSTGRTDGEAPSMKKAERVEVPPARERRTYDRARDATYVNIVVTLLERAQVEAAAGGKDREKGRAKASAAPAPAFAGREVTLTFQLIYRGARAYDLIGAHLIVESVAPPEQGEKLSAARQLEVKADPYEYTYERADYRAESVALAGAAAAGTPPVRREMAAFPLPVEDLPQITGAGRLSVRVGAEQFAVRSAQLSELRRALAAGVEE